MYVCIYIYIYIIERDIDRLVIQGNLPTRTARVKLVLKKEVICIYLLYAYIIQQQKQP